MGPQTNILTMKLLEFITYSRSLSMKSTVVEILALISLDNVDVFVLRMLLLLGKIKPQEMLSHL